MAFGVTHQRDDAVPSRPRRRALAALGALTLVTALVTGVALLTSPSGVANAEAAVTVQRAHTGAGTPSLKGRVTFLVIGSDSGAPRHGRGGTAQRGRADAIHLIVFDAAKRKGISIGFPRDSYVPIPGRGTGKINAAMSSGGPSLLIRTIEQLTGIRVDYYALTSFDGLVDIVDKVGGVTVGVDQNLVDRFSGANFRKGTQKLKGGQALAYSRARHGTPQGDITRSKHQGQVLLGGLATFRKHIAKDPAQVMRWLAVTNDEVQTDIPFTELLRLALVATQVPPRNINNVVAPGTPGSAGGASVVRLQPAAFALFNRVRHGQLA
ncbi:MAG TPA: LCP family protein [Actinomycetes bacterium]|nr:LCP family protein [Actinomycetes bacterium]